MKTKQKIELLSPARDFDTLKVAIDSGADAVYLGGSRFSARKAANSFDEKTLQEALDYAHIRGKKIHVAVNTLIKDTEMRDCLLYVDFLHKVGVDALIVQDLGLIFLIKKFFPDLVLHGSTQLAAMGVEDAVFFEKIGAKRLVVPREMTLTQVKELVQNTNLDIEVFAHGALCVSYSGRCLFSALNGGRSGNRGDCAQVCRKPYELRVNGKIINDQNSRYLLSPKDINTSHYLDDLIDAGIASLKIEGRMKNPDYVRAVTRVYRYLIDEHYQMGSISKASYRMGQSTLSKVFNRGFSKGYILGDKGSAIINSFSQKPLGQVVAKVMGYNKKTKKLKIKLLDDLYKNDGLSIGEKVGRIIKEDGQITDSAKKSEVVYLDSLKNLKTGQIIYKNYFARIDLPKVKSKDRAVHLSCEIKLGEKPKLTLDCDNKRVVVVADYIVQPAQKAPLDEQSTLERLTKVDNYPFEIRVASFDMDEEIFVPVKVLNQLRRDALAILAEKLLYKAGVATKNKEIKSYFDERVEQREKLDKGLEDTSEHENTKAVKNIRAFVNCIDESLEEEIENLKRNLSVDLVKCHKKIFTNYHQIDDEKYEVAGYQLNIYNSFTHEFYNQRDKYTVCSLENIFANDDRYIYSLYKEKMLIPANVYPELMYTEFCPHKDEKGRCKYDYYCKLPYTTIINEEMDVFNFRRVDAGCKVVIEQKEPMTLSKDKVKTYSDLGYDNLYFEIREKKDLQKMAQLLNWS